MARKSFDLKSLSSGLYRTTSTDEQSCFGVPHRAYLLNNGSLEKAQMMAAHESPRTTKLYDRTNDQISLDEVERILLE
jgi:integrase/recombinase XerD